MMMMTTTISFPNLPKSQKPSLKRRSHKHQPSQKNPPAYALQSDHASWIPLILNTDDQAPEPTTTHEVDEIDEEAALALLEEEDDVQGGGAAEELDDEDAAALAILEGEDDDNDEVQQKVRIRGRH